MPDETNEQENIPPHLRKPPTAVELFTEQGPQLKDAYKTRCRGCTSMLMVPLPLVHCPACHHVWRARKLSSPSRCARCDFSLWKWRQLNNVKDNGNENALTA